MAGKPIPERSFRAFLSHADVDKDAIVNSIYSWCREKADIKAWLDKVNLGQGRIGGDLATAIGDSQAGIVVLSKASVGKQWVQNEWNLFITEQSNWPDFQIVPMRLDDCEVPKALTIYRWLDLARSGFDPEVATLLIERLHGYQTKPDNLDQRQVYLSRGSRPAEVAKARKVLDALHANGIRVVRDAPDHPKMDPERIRRIMQGCSGFVALIPNRDGKTSGFILDEVRLAIEERLPLWLVVDEGLGEDIVPPAVINVARLTLSAAEIDDKARLGDAAETFKEQFDSDVSPAYCFFGHVYRDDTQALYRLASRCIEAVAGMRCHTGDELFGDTLQPEIVERITSSTFAIFDISDDDKEPDDRSGSQALNTCIEAGIAIGAGVPMHLIARGPRRDPPFMFRNREVFYYETPLDLIGLMRRLSRPYRRVSE
jgi:hypothetical protein